MLLQEYYNSNSKGAKKGTPIVKLLIIFSYFTVLSVMALTVVTVTSRNTPVFFEALLHYFFCKLDPSNTGCDRKSFQKHRLPLLVILSYALYNIYPLVCLTYAIDISKLREMSSKYFRLKPGNKKHPSTTGGLVLQMNKPSVEPAATL